MARVRWATGYARRVISRFRFTTSPIDVKAIAKKYGVYAGRNVYNVTGFHQTKRVWPPIGRSVLFRILTTNMGTDDTYTWKGEGSRHGFSVHYYDGSKDITQDVEAGTYSRGVIIQDSMQIDMVITGELSVWP